jgi:hypothetical protein
MNCKKGQCDGTPGPETASKMASKMAHMMPMMAGRMLSGCSDEDRKKNLFEMVANLISEATSNLTDNEYSALIEELSGNLMKRKPAGNGSEKTCC